MHFLLFYEVVDGYGERRVPLRPAHLAHARRAASRGDLLLGGAFGRPADGAALLFTGDSPEVAERFAEEDPYVKGGLIKAWYVREWTTVVGPLAAAPLPDDAS